MDPELVELNVSDFVALFNQTMEIAYPEVVITGELANLRVSRNKWIYFDLKDESSSIKFFGTVYHLPGPLEDGLMIKVRGQPRLHNLYGFSINVMSMQPAGEGSIKKAADLLKQKLLKEGLFDEARKRPLPYPPTHIGLITSKQSAAYADFIKIINARWAGLKIELIDVLVQGDSAPAQIVSAINQFNANPEPPETLVLIRGGGSAEDLMSFSTEEVTRAVASSRVPTLVAIGHEIDISLAELAADQRASTPSNAAELLVPDKSTFLFQLDALRTDMFKSVKNYISLAITELETRGDFMEGIIDKLLKDAVLNLEAKASVVSAFNPNAILKRGYAIVRDKKDKILRNSNDVRSGDVIDIKLYKGRLRASVQEIND